MDTTKKIKVAIVTVGLIAIAGTILWIIFHNEKAFGQEVKIGGFDDKPPMVEVCRESLRDFTQNQDKLDRLSFSAIEARIGVVGDCIQSQSDKQNLSAYLLATSSYLLDENRRMRDYIQRHKQIDSFLAEDTIALDSRKDKK